ncbi:hypothetical protein FA13DRAFT_1720374 [Coprinellus micaceus]|uniref:Uncharacterized protein n=1 Tax=Coprinellus micaceus TaxID=71717 RepID=A0A4Y7SA79_COPMI|nr:hypothetical protein FA13DRAFT_1720374 [Coprinellus micaceus]
MDVLSHLLMTNTAPNQLEGQYIQGQIQTRSDAIEKLQLELQACKALLSPLCRFPLENLGEIFTATLGPGESIFTPRSPRQLVQLRLVCKAWWHAALATPQLWCSIQIGFNHNSVCFKGVRLWVSRARTKPLTLILNPGREMAFNSVSFERLFCLQHNCPLLNPGFLELIKTGPHIGALSVTCQSQRCLQRLSELVDPQPWDSIHAFKFQAPALVETRATSAHLVFPHIPPAIT